MKHYAIELRRAPECGGWQWEVWLSDDLVMVAQGWMLTRADARRAAQHHALWLEAQKKQVTT